MKSVPVAVTSLLLCVLLAGAHPAPGGPPNLKTAPETVTETLPSRPRPISYRFPDQEQEYRESPLRRFEIVFFISLPASLLFSLAGASAFSLGSEGALRFTSPAYGYILVSSVGISLALALRDHKVVYGKGGSGFETEAGPR
ncbi:MAG: hypothetical protein ACOC8N_00700 [Spirochaetota bacterium]